MNSDPRGPIYRSLQLFPLQPDDPAYVSCESVRGEQDVLQELGDTIVLSGEEDGYTCQLYTGARGSGKSTELLRLRQDLERKGYFVVYFEADRGDIEIDDTEHTDILLACTRHIIEDLKDFADSKPLLDWLKNRLQSLTDLGSTEVELEKVGFEFQIAQLGKLMTKFKSVPDLRTEVRRKSDLYTPSLVESLNQFIDKAKEKLPAKYNKREIVVIVDNLDRIVLINENGRSNYERIFLDRKNLMRGLNCHVIYTVPISMKYAYYSGMLVEDYDRFVTMPMIMIKAKDGREYQPGIDVLKNIIEKRLQKAQVSITLDNFFESSDALDELCTKSGGYIRNLMQLVQAAVKRAKSFPIPDRAVNIAISELRQIYRDSLYADDWIKLAIVYLSKQLPSDTELLFRRCVLNYLYTTQDGRKEYWYDIHPLIIDMPEFQESLSTLSNIPKSSEVGDVDDIALAGMDNVYKLYEEALTNNDYEEVVKIADLAYKMLDNIAASLDRNKDRDTYRRIVALSSYWQLNKNLYTSRSKS